ncbi:MAG: hypothetical protein M3308_04935, partial [Actinomycetota bacterium]|nr:hypothetical protein [Actinomycetota bacterium]
FAESDPVLPNRWRHGVIARSGGAGHARDLVSGRLFTTGGRRQVYIFDHVQGAKTDAVVVAVQVPEAPAGLIVEFWLASVPFTPDSGLDLLGSVGVRYAFVDMGAARLMLTSQLGRACDDLGSDIPVAWLEQHWMLAAAPVGAPPARLERLLRALGEVADQLEVLGGDGSFTSPAAAPQPRENREDTGRPDRSFLR